MKSSITFAVRCLTLAATTLSLSITTVEAQEWAVEGPISAINAAGGTLTAQGVTVTFPADLEIEGTAGITGATLALLLDENAPSRVRSIYSSAPGAAVGYTAGTLKAEGEIITTAAGRTFQVTAAVVELAENVLVGELDSVDEAAGTFVVNGVPCRLNPDERFPQEILDAGGEPIAFADLNGAVGSVIGVIGYFHDGVQYAVTVETETLPTNPGTDTVRITRAEGRADKGELRIEGVVTPFDATTRLTVSDADTGTVLSVEAVAAGDIVGQGSFRIRLRGLNLVPARVRAVSSNGGEHIVDVSIR